MRYLCVLAVLSRAIVLHGVTVPRAYTVETLAGGGGNGEGGQAKAAQLGYLQGIATDRFGNLYIAETDNHRVRKIAPNGAILTVAGTGTEGFGGDGGPGVAARLNLPWGLAADAAGNLFIADFGNSRVRRVGPDGIISTVAGTGAAASSGDGGPATAAGLLEPRNLAVDGSGNLYISEFGGNRVRRVAPDGRIDTIAGTGVAGYGGDGGPANRAQLNAPAGLALDSTGTLYIGDTANHRIRRVSPAGYISTVADLSKWNIMPIALAVDPHGKCYMTDGLATVWRCSADLPAVAGSQPGFQGDGGPGVNALLNSARDLALDGAGNLYIADSTAFERGLAPLGRVRRVDTRGTIETVAGDGYVAAIGDGGPASAALLYLPFAVSLDGAGNLYIGDTGTQRVRRADPTGAIHTLAGTGIAARGADLSIASQSALYSPHGVWVEPIGTVLIADTYNHRIRRVTADGRIATVIGSGTAGLEADGMSWEEAQLNAPLAVCTDLAGTIFVADTSNHRVLRAAQGEPVAIAAGNGSAGFGGDGGPARDALLDQPSACAVDTAGNLFIADTGNHRIRKVTPDGRIATAAGNGIPGFAGDEGDATAASLSFPSGLAVTSNGDLFIADTGSNRVRQVTPDGIIHTIAGQGAAGFAGDGGPALEARFNGPAGLVLDGAGDVYVADAGNNRVRRLVPQDPVLPPAPVTAAVSVVNAASLLPGAAAPGEIVTIFGSGMGPDTGVAGALDSAGLVTTLLGETEVLFDGVRAPLFYVRKDQINAQAPYELAGKTAAHVEVRYRGAVAGAADVAVWRVAPAVFSVAANQDLSPNSETAPAARGSVITFYATGEGLTDGIDETGRPAAAPYARPRQPVSVTIAGIPADILYAGSAPAAVGLMQVNARVPDGSVPAGAQKLELSVGATKAPEITIWLK